MVESHEAPASMMAEKTEINEQAINAVPLHRRKAADDIDPNDPHNVLWPKLLELALTLPFVLGFRTKDVARLLAATLCLEAASVWQFWWVAPLEARLHMREHFAVNVAVAGGLLLLQDLGGGRYTVDAWLKKAS